MRIVFGLFFAPIGAAVIWLFRLGRVSYWEIYYRKPENTKEGFQDPIARARNGFIGMIVFIVIVMIILKLTNPHYTFIGTK
jgi:hypothetical protein